MTDKDDCYTCGIDFPGCRVICGGEAEQAKAAPRRDLLADRQTCESATPGPWELCTGEVFYHLLSAVFHYDQDGKMVFIADMMPKWFLEDKQVGKGTVPDDHRPNMHFFLEARAGWPHAIDRATQAESEVARLRGLLKAELCGRCPTPRPGGECPGTCAVYRQIYGGDAHA